MNISKLKNNILVFDIETSSHFHGGKEIDIRSDYDTYVLMAKVKFFGAYSYKHDKFYNLEVSKNKALIYELLKEHKVYVGFNNESFDIPVLENNGFIEPDDYHIVVDCMSILGKSNFKSKNGFAFKNKGFLMNYNFSKNSLRHMAEVMKIDTQKGDIDYKIFHKNEWNELEKSEIVKYLSADVKANKEVFDKLWDYWLPFTDLLNDKNIKNLSWIRSSIASLIYKSACQILDVEEDYSEATNRGIEEMGGRVIEPRVEEKENIWYIDFASLYPHIFCMFNLFSEVKEGGWSGNELFKVRGNYDISEPHKLSLAVQEKLKTRIDLKKTDPDHPMIYTLKIWLNGLYGAIRSPIFKNIHTPNSGWDCCWLGQQIQEHTEKRMREFGFESIYGDTDSLMVFAVDEKNNNEKYVRKCLIKIIGEIFDNVPFPVKTFKIDIEDYLDYVMFPFDEQPIVDKEIRTLLKDNDVEGYIKALDEYDKKIIIRDEDGLIVKKGNKWTKVRKGKKKNYSYIYEKDGKKDVKLVGLPIIKENATKLGILIYKDKLKDEIIKNNNAKFDRKRIDDIISKYVEKPNIMKLIAVEYKVKPANTYKNQTGIHAQISNGYLGEGGGVISLIKNHKIGNVGKGSKYCTIEEALVNGLKREDLDLEKVYNELEPFIKHEAVSDGKSS